MEKKTIVKIGVAVTSAIALTVAGKVLYNRHKKNKTQTVEEVDENRSENNVEEIEDNTKINEVVDTVIDDEIDDSDDRNAVLKYVAYLIKNGIDSEEAISICETISNIRIELPERFSEVRMKMEQIMESEFDLEKSHEFNKENFNILYSSIDLTHLFIKNGFKILAMGKDCQEDMMNLAEALVDLQQDDSDDVLSVLYEIYHIFTDLKESDITETTYEEKFKPYVDVYVTKHDETEEVKSEKDEPAN